MTDDQAKRQKKQRLLEQERLILDVTESLCGAMASQLVTRANLAERLVRSRGYVSQLLNGERNMTLRTLSDLCSALDLCPDIQLRTPKEAARHDLAGSFAFRFDGTFPLDQPQERQFAFDQPQEPQINASTVQGPQDPIAGFEEGIAA